MPHNPPIDPSLCPLCGQANRCAMELEKETGMAQGPCWCTAVTFDSAQLDSVPDTAKRLACICTACASKSRTRTN